MLEPMLQDTTRAACSDGGGADMPLAADAPIQRSDSRDRLVAIVGPTAVGKTDLAMKLAQHVSVEIVGADSRQVYRYMDIGTAKPSPEERASVTHHLVDIIDPCDEFSLQKYIYSAKQAIPNAKRSGNVSLLVGGTGQYIKALLEGWTVPPVPPDFHLRCRLEADLAASGVDRLVAELRSVDPAALEAVDLKNPRRIIRAIERALAGHPWGAHPNKVAPNFDSIVIGLSADRTQLYAKADLRLDAMMTNGFLAEVGGLLDAGYAPELPAMSGIGYSELVDHLLNGADLKDVVQRAKYRTHRYIRQQFNWFRASDTRINWFEMCDTDAAVEYALSWIESSKF